MHPQNAYRNGPLYGAYVVENMMRTYELSREAGIHIEGAVTWAFMFDGQPWYDGFRDLATNGIPKAVLNAFRLMGKLDGEWLQAESDGALPLEQVLGKGIRREPDVNCVATRDEAGVSVLVWHYHDDNVVTEDQTVPVELSLNGLPEGEVSVREYRMDADHGNSHGAWQKMGSPQEPSAEQVAELQRASELPCIGEERRSASGGSLTLSTRLPRQGVGLYRIEF